MKRWADRRSAGRRLGGRLIARWGAGAGGRVVVLGLPRGGVPVAAEVAAALSAPLDVLLVRKLGTPGQVELAMGAVGEGGVVVRNADVIDRAPVTPERFQAVLEAERAALADRAARYRAVRDPVPITGCTAVVVDDGIATGATARAACAVARARGAAVVVLAAPVIARSTAQEFARGVPSVADDVVALLCPRRFGGVGQFYADFAATAEQEVLAILRAAAGR